MIDTIFEDLEKEGYIRVMKGDLCIIQEKLTGEVHLYFPDNLKLTEKERLLKDFYYNKKN